MVHPGATEPAGMSDSMQETERDRPGMGTDGSERSGAERTRLNLAETDVRRYGCSVSPVPVRSYERVYAEPI